MTALRMGSWVVALLLALKVSCAKGQTGLEIDASSGASTPGGVTTSSEPSTPREASTPSEAAKPEGTAAESASAPTELAPLQAEPVVAEDESAVPPYERGGHRGADSLARAALDGLELSDPEMLRKLRVNREFYRNILWPEFEKDLSYKQDFDFIWELSCANSAKAIVRAISSLGGEECELVRVTFSRIDEYETFRLWRGTELEVIRREDGEPIKIEILGSMVERNGRFWLLSYKD